MKFPTPIIQQACAFKSFMGEKYVDAGDGSPGSRRPRGTTLRDIISPLIAAILVSGCTAAYSPAPLPTNHPANPAAPEASPPPPSQALKETPTPTDETPGQALHSEHGAMHGDH